MIEPRRSRDQQTLYIVLLGAPGAGKGTQAAALAAHLGLAHISSGDLFRENLQQGTELGLLARSYMERGELVPDEVTISMVMERLAPRQMRLRPPPWLPGGTEGGPQRGAILDGFPRTLRQARALDVALGEQEGGLALALLIEVNDEDVIDRLSGRRVCGACGAVYHVLYNPPQVEGVCNVCGAQGKEGRLIQREDDRPETVRRRLYTYYKETGPLIGYYFCQGLLVEIDGGQGIEQVQGELRRAVEARVGR